MPDGEGESGPPPHGRALSPALPLADDPAPVLQALTRSAGQAMLRGAEIATEMAAGLPPRSDAAGEALASANLRLPDAAAFAELGKAVRRLIAQQKFASSSIEVREAMGFPAYNASEEGKQMARMAQDIYERLGGKVEMLERTYGTTDAIWASQSGRLVIETMGLPGGNYHSSDEEFVLIDRIGRRVALVAEMIRALAAR